MQRRSCNRRRTLKQSLASETELAKLARPVALQTLCLSQGFLFVRHSLQDVAELQADLAALTTGWRQSALEVDASCVMEVWR